MNYIIRFAITLLTLLLLGCTNANKTALSQPKNDSIKKYLELASNDTLSFPDRNKYNKKAFSFIDLSKNDTLTRWYLFQITKNSISISDEEGYSKTIKIFLKKTNDVKDTLCIARYFRLKGGYSGVKRVFDSAYYYYLKSEFFYKKANNIAGLGEVYLFKGIVQNNINDYLGCELSTKKAFAIFNKKKNYKRKYQCYTSFGINYGCLKDYKKGIEYNLKALDLAKNYLHSSVDNNLIGTSLNNIGSMYKELKNYKKAIFYFKTAKKNEMETKKDPELLAYLDENLAYCYLKLKKKNEVSSLLHNSLKIFLKYNNKKEAGINCMYLSQFYNEKGDITRAKFYSETSLKLTKDSDERYYYLTILSYAGTINTQKAPFYLQEYHRLNDSLMFAERNARNQFYKIQLDVDEITQEKDNAIVQKWVIASMMSGILLIVILLFVIFYQKSKQKEVELLQAQQKANEETYQMFLNQQALQDEAKTVEKKRIALELHDNILNKLASIRFNLYPITQKNDPEVQKNAEKHVNRIKDVEDEIRTISHDFSNDLFAEAYSFKIILEKLIAEQNKLYPDTQYRLELEEKINLDSISSKIKMNMYRIIQEALYNVHKHAKATKVAVAIIQDENNICISILDNGIGFDTSKTKEGIGIKNIKLRIKQLSGKISVISSKKHGTAINMAIPIITINK